MEDENESLCKSCRHSFEVTYLERDAQEINGHIFCTKYPTLIKFDDGKVVVNCTGWSKKK